MAAKKKRRRHPGVTLIAADEARRIGHRARYRDPDSGKLVKVSLDTALRTVEMREDWATRKSKAIAKRRLELESGAHRATNTGLTDALKRFWEDHATLRPRTIEIYRGAATKLEDWAKTAGIRSADDITGPRLVAFRAELAREPRTVHALGGKRGSQRSTGEPRRPSTVNVELRAVRTILGYLRKLGLLARITTDALSDGLEPLAVSHDRGVYLNPKELQALLEAAIAHDVDTFAATREEHAGLRPLGSTQRYQPIAPLIACALLTGMRFGEAVTLEWSQVDLDALGDDGKAVGEIHLSAATKTKRARTVDLTVSPALRDLLLAMRERDGGDGAVFSGTRLTAEAAAKRMRKDYGAPKTFTWQALRRSCGTYLTNAPGIFGAASAYRSAKQLGHSVAVAEKHYVGVIRGIPRDARTLENAMQIETQMTDVIAAVGQSPAKKRTSATG